MKFELGLKKKDAAKRRSSKVMKKAAKDGKKGKKPSKPAKKPMKTLDYIRIYVSRAPSGSVIKMNKGPYKGLTGKVERIGAAGINVRFDVDPGKLRLIDMAFLKKNKDAFTVVKKFIPKKKQKQQDEMPEMLRGYKESYSVVDDDGDTDAIITGAMTDGGRPVAKIVGAKVDAEGKVIKAGKIIMATDGDIVGEMSSTLRKKRKEFDIPALFMDYLTDGKNITIPKKVYDDIKAMQTMLNESGVDQDDANIMKAITVARILFLLNETNPDYVAYHHYTTCLPDGFKGNVFNDHYFLACIAETGEFVQPVLNPDTGAPVMDVNNLVANFVNMYQHMDKDLHMKKNKARKPPKPSKAAKTPPMVFAPPTLLKLKGMEHAKKGVKNEYVIAGYKMSTVDKVMNKMNDLEADMTNVFGLYNSGGDKEVLGSQFDTVLKEYKNLYDSIKENLSEMQQDIVEDKIDNFDNMNMKMLFGGDLTDDDDEESDFEKIVKNSYKVLKSKQKKVTLGEVKEEVKKALGRKLSKDEKDAVKNILLDMKK